MVAGGRPTPSVVWARLYLGLVVFVGAEVLSGSSAGVGLISGWTWVVTFWLYFSHFFLFTTLAVRTGRTSLGSLYLWGALFGLYESWITKVVWSGYDGGGVFAFGGEDWNGAIGGLGVAEFSTAVLFHPIFSFILQLFVATRLMPELRGVFPGLDRLASGSRGWQWVWGFWVVAMAGVMALNTLTLPLLLMTWGQVLPALWLGNRELKETFGVAGMGKRVLMWDGVSWYLLLAYLGFFYVLFYNLLRVEDIPGPGVIWATVGLYALAALALWRRGRAEEGETPESPAPLTQVVWPLKWVVGLSFLLGVVGAVVPGALMVVVLPAFVVWGVAAPVLFFGVVGVSVVGRRKIG